MSKDLQAWRWNRGCGMAAGRIALVQPVSDLFASAPHNDSAANAAWPPAGAATPNARSSRRVGADRVSRGHPIRIASGAGGNATLAFGELSAGHRLRGMTRQADASLYAVAVK